MDYTTLLLILLLAHVTIQTCTINEFQLVSTLYREPLILDAKKLEFIYPLDKNNGKIITVDEDAEILVSCAASTIQIPRGLSIDGKTIRAKCNSNTQFMVNGSELKVEEVYCSSDYLEVATDISKKCAGDKGIIIDVSYPVEVANDKVPLYEICFDRNGKTVFYSKFTSPELANIGNGYRGRPGVPPESDADFYGVSDLDVFTILNSPILAKNKVNQLVGLPKDYDKYFPSTNTTKIAINKDLLSDYVFFFYRNQQHSTGRYINSIPIWEVYHYDALNNWDSIRFGLRQFTIDNRYELEIYTGTYGVATLPHEDSSKGDVEIYLSRDNTKTFPLAKLLWRLVYNKKAKSAIVFVTVNNPWVVKDDDKICEDVSSQFGWDSVLTWDRTRSDLMYSYACKYEDFKKTVTFVPELEVKSVLNSSHKHGISLLVIALCALIWKFL